MAVDGVIWLSAQDYDRLRTLVSNLARGPRRAQAGITTLEEILDLARVVKPEKVPGNVVTMNSRVLYEDVHKREKGTVTIVFPADADPLIGRISVLSPVGAALLGETEGNEMELPLPHDQKRRIRIDRVLYQPEAEGNYVFNATSATSMAHDMRHPHYPLEQIVRSRSTRFQRGFARMAMHLLSAPKDVIFDATDNGLCILGTSELALVRPQAVMQKMHGEDVEFGELRVRLYCRGTVHEPVMWLKAGVPQLHAEAVVNDLITRGAEINAVDWFAVNPVVRARAPLRQLLGYPKELVTLSAGKADLQIWLSHYAPVPPEPGKAA